MAKNNDAAIQDYLNKGGKITVCPPADKPVKSKIKQEPKIPTNGHDKEICAACPNRGACMYPCEPLHWINGNVPLKERYLSEPIEEYDIPDYKAILYDLSKTVSPEDRINEIKKLRNFRVRAICAMLTVDIPTANIAALLHISRTHLYRTLTKAVHADIQVTLKTCESDE
jgi:hypothetical protein